MSINVIDLIQTST